ncbi:type III secretion protein [Phreatobacter aquaticus]|uniref:Type III secretion protein n=1 Tax=Phreatobacter aquaticus TaxID=2570229 RepID=A0A4D7QG37_9HYPH|nr:EscU/YscU/HrcU family type III secretion system export apparatus switch protein [Phreatobacter aquaticus]QCK84406.1 type III secretion protein [Phreatobacter aquaticus]
MSTEDTPKKPAIAVALEYEHGQSAVPKVIATGRGIIAEKIIQTARENGIAIEGNPLLAEALAGVGLEEEIPEELYRAVAEVIGFVLRAAGKLR